MPFITPSRKIPGTPPSCPRRRVPTKEAHRWGDYRKLLPLLAFLATPSNAAADCKTLTHDQIPYSVCTFDPARTTITLALNDDNGQPYGNLPNFIKSQKNKGIEPIFAMNAGMYDAQNQPVGLYIENGKQIKKLNTASGYGNFHMKPNGVFFIKGRKAGVRETSRYTRQNPRADFATQSGPMLVMDGKLHPRFQPDSRSFKVRNGVGVRKDGQVVFVLSHRGVSFHAFASFFRDELNCPNALYLDGTISSLHAPQINQSGGFWPTGPIISARSE